MVPFLQLDSFLQKDPFFRLHRRLLLLSFVYSARFISLDALICTAAHVFPDSQVSPLRPISQARPVTPVRSISPAGTHVRQANRFVHLLNPQLQRDDSVDWVDVLPKNQASGRVVGNTRSFICSEKQRK